MHSPSNVKYENIIRNRLIGLNSPEYLYKCYILNCIAGTVVRTVSMLLRSFKMPRIVMVRVCCKEFSYCITVTYFIVVYCNFIKVYDSSIVSRWLQCETIKR
jgi:hypothetical protein